MSDKENPEWTDEDFARATPMRDIQTPGAKRRLALAEKRKAELEAARQSAKRAKEAGKSQITIRLDNDVIEHFKAGGEGWQTRLNRHLRRSLGI
ncbi:MAG: BrnA antitoxin family protein [Neomegalonema sp.]|nr:BrnA antitoxin family protein [Neomegalonema sp.]